MMNGIGGDLFAIVYDAKTKQGLRPQRLRLGAQGAHPRISHREGHPAHALRAASIPPPCPARSPAGMRCCDASAPRSFRRRARSGDRLCQGGLSRQRDVRRRLGRAAAIISSAMRKRRGSSCRGAAFPRSAKSSAIPISPVRSQQIAQGGSDAFYKGAIAQQILDTSAKLGGTMTADDLAEFAAEWVDPISTDYRGWTVYELPPNEQGIAALMMLNIMSTSPIGQWGHNSVAGAAPRDRGEEARLCRHDPLCRRSPLRQGAGGGNDLGGLRPRARASSSIPPRPIAASAPARRPITGSDTTYLSTVDRDGNMVSLIQSNFGLFGSGVAVEGGGFVLHNRGALFTLEHGHPNELAGRKRPLHTIIPALMMNAATSASPSASWAASTRPRRMRSSCRTSSTTA